jgi:hypothetical protein
VTQARILSGHEVAEAVYKELKEKLASLSFVPSLRVIRLGEDPASVSYVRLKDRRARELGLRSQVEVYPEDFPEEALLERIEALNRDEDVDGILVQLPLPRHIRAERILEAISPLKDVDGFHPVNVGRLWSGGGGAFPLHTSWGNPPPPALRRGAEGQGGGGHRPLQHRGEAFGGPSPPGGRHPHPWPTPRPRTCRR